jgi:lysophospholipase L1-like esterase
MSILSPMKRSAQLTLIALAGFVLGALCQEKLYLIRSLQTGAKAVIGDPMLQRWFPRTTDRPRNSIFEAFHPHADFVMVGDSLTEAAEWREIFPEVRIVNRGISGDRTDDILRRMDAIFATGAKRAFVMAGFNDFALNQSVATAFGNYRKIVDQLTERGTYVYIQSTLECSRDVCGRILDDIRALNELLRDYAGEKGLIFIDINKSLASPEVGLLKQYTYDGIHLLGTGYVQWKRAIEQHVRN